MLFLRIIAPCPTLMVARNPQGAWTHLETGETKRGIGS